MSPETRPPLVLIPAPTINPRTTDPRSVSPVALTCQQAIRDFQAELAFAERSWNTRNEYRKELARFATWLTTTGYDYHHITTRQIKGYLQTRAHRTPSTRRAMVTHLRGFFRWCITEEHRPDSPLTGITLPRLPKPVPKALNGPQVQRLVGYLMAHIADGPRQHRDFTVLACALYAGLRAQEIADLTWDDVTTAGIVVRVSKWNRGRTIDLHPALAAILVEWRTVQASTRSDVAIGTLNERPIVADRIGKIARRYAKLLHLPMSAHVLRHTFATRAIQTCGDLYSVSKALGHAHLSHTEPYLRATAKDTARAVQSLPALEDW